MSERKAIARGVERLFAEAGLQELRAPQGIEVWKTCLALSQRTLGLCNRTLSPEEQMRAAGYGNSEARYRFIARHGLLRALLAERLGIEPSEVRLAPDHRKKPVLADRSLKFNISFSRDTALFAFSSTDEIGVDVEAVQLDFPFNGVVRDHFTIAERSLLDSLPVTEQPRLFFAMWTRKEACAKALGIGITVSFVCYETALPFGATGTPLGVVNSGTPDSNITVWDIDVGDAGFCAALARSSPP